MTTKSLMENTMRFSGKSFDLEGPKHVHPEFLKVKA